ncbi:MAG: hypothetical protein PUG76_03945 [Prevotellaceae bacterium]|nr:hypothetical protein [Prevotellaceae bacterium]
MGNIVESTVDGEQLLLAIANKDKDSKGAEKALYLFTSYFESKIKLFVEIHASKLGYDEHVAFEAIQCTFNKVWLYPTFDKSKSRVKNVERAIIIWLENIAVSQMHQFTKKGECAQIKPDEDLSIIEDSVSFVDFHISDLEPEQKMMYVMALNNKISKLDEKHRIVYLTYKAYHTRGKKLPRKLLDMLRKRLNITQTTIRVYKREAYLALNDLDLIDA